MLDLDDADVVITHAEALAQLGYSLAVPGDLDGDGRDDLLAGAPTATGGADRSGVAFVFRGPIGSGSTADADARIEGAVGAWYDDVYDYDEGSALGPGDADHSLLGVNRSDWMGKVACGGGDVDGDGQHDLIVGGDGLDEGGTQAGGVYLLTVLSPSTQRLDLAASATLLGEGSYEYVGHSGERVGDLNGDGREDMVLGAFGRRAEGGILGAAFVFTEPPTGTRPIGEAAQLQLLGTGAEDETAWGLSSAGDWAGDGRDAVAVGAPLNDDGGEDAGTVTVSWGGPR